MQTHLAPSHLDSLPGASEASGHAGRGMAQYFLLGDLLKLLPGSVFEQHTHPAAVLDLATGPGTSVWGWWSTGADGEASVPCLLWAGELGWSATTVEPDLFDTDGYERSFWSHRIKLLDLAIANAIGPFPTLEELQYRVAEDAALDVGCRSAAVTGSLLWGIAQQQRAQARVAAGVTMSGFPAIAARGAVGEDLEALRLSPDRAKVRLEDGGLAGLRRAMEEVRHEPTRRMRLLHGWKQVIPRRPRTLERQSA